MAASRDGSITNEAAILIQQHKSARAFDLIHSHDDEIHSWGHVAAAIISSIPHEMVLSGAETCARQSSHAAARDVGDPEIHQRGLTESEVDGGLSAEWIGAGRCEFNEILERLLRELDRNDAARIGV